MVLEMERWAGAEQFTTEDREIFTDNGFVIAQPKERSLYDFENEGYRFVALPEFLKNRDRIFSEKSRKSEIAYIPTGIYLPDSYRHSSYEEQRQLLLEMEVELKRIGIKKAKVIFPSVADCMEIADIEAKKGNNIFGYEFGYLYTRTSTENDPNSTVIIGCDDLDIRLEERLDGVPEGEFRGIHLMDYPKANNNHAGLYVMGIVEPVV